MSLTVDGIHTYYGQSHVLQGISLNVGDGETVALLGRNGAGKTTTMRSIVGLTPARSGSIRLDDKEISRLQAYRLARLGLSFVPSGRRVYGSLTVRQNLALAAERPRKEAAWSLERVHDMFPNLVTLAGRQAGHLSGGEQQMLKLARALLGGPRILLLDEPTEGLAPGIVADLGRWLAILRKEKVTVLITEQNALFALRYADRGYIIEKGTVRYEAPAAELRDSAEIRRYLGVGVDT
ncbi:ABC transporter ATP-binding protein [Leekyejoonella antrihumi]|uniref:ABC transporter ATP-binding protein n=1 Tax=Leekyejoonella antrihumi TaxID=1660198 RepID=A0A563E6B2_9MICO|nr:ABC transporter ATP-binding protein [Leekyejoonella antrihumi]TWP38047.1 ABC transporter ATP-binding protein [Leekyejoonella antrihumi]